MLHLKHSLISVSSPLLDLLLSLLFSQQIIYDACNERNMIVNIARAKVSILISQGNLLNFKVL